MLILRVMWSIEKAPCINEIGVNKYGISFKIKEFLKRATKKGPWSVMKSCLVVKKWPNGDLVEEIEFSEIGFWLQIHNLPMELLTSENAEVIEGRLG